MRTKPQYYNPETDHSTLQPTDDRYSLTVRRYGDGSRWTIGEDEIDEEAPTLTREEAGPAKPLEIGADMPLRAAQATTEATAAFRDLEADIANGDITPEAAALAYNRIANELADALGIA